MKTPQRYVFQKKGWETVGRAAVGSITWRNVPQIDNKSAQQFCEGKISMIVWEDI